MAYPILSTLTPCSLLTSNSKFAELRSRNYKSVKWAEAGHHVRAIAVVREETSGGGASMKAELLAAIAGLDRGRVASESDIEAADMAARRLEASCSVELAEGIDRLQGKWRLIFSSAFASGSLGGRRPGPPFGRLPFTLGKVYQIIDVANMELDNIVDLQISNLWPFPSLDVTLILAHAFKVTGDGKVKIFFNQTRIQPRGSLSQLPPFVIPQLPEIFGRSNIRTAEFQVTYLDQDFRITRGDLGELRLFVQA